MKNSQKRGILIIEDNDINREMLKVILNDTYRITEACDGEEGLIKLRENIDKLSLVLLDVHMPRMNGYEFLEEYRKDPILSSVPVIVTTGNSITDTEEKCLSLGASDFVTKPYNPRIILKRIEAIIRLKESITSLEAVERDSLSGLYTKDAFCFYVSSKIKDTSKNYDMMIFYIEDFQHINVRYGDYLATELIKYISSNILMYDGVFACRYDQDKFFVLREHDDCDHVKLTREFDDNLQKNSPIPDFSIKYGIYNNIPHDISIAEVFDRLSITVSGIKRNYNKKIAVFDNEVIETTKRIRQIEECMTQALTDEQFTVYYQPKHDAKTGKISGAEALVRWIHPEYGFLSPGEFIPLFEQNGFITGLDFYVWEKVCSHINLWQAQNITPVPVSVNASRRDFLVSDNLLKLTSPIEENKIDKKYLHLEITESGDINDKFLIEKIGKIRNAGIGIELDDFGAGQSALGTLCDIPLDVLKIDISFIRSLDKQKEVVRTIISLAHALGLKTVAEGVETKEQIEALKAMGCDCFQGYYYSKPLPEQQFREYLKKELIS